MSDVRSLSDSGIHAATAILERLVSYLPSFAAAIVLVFVGWVVAKTMRALAIRTALLIDTVLPRLGLPAGLSRFRVARGSVVVGTVVYWLVLLFFVTTATQVLGLQAFTDWLSKLIDYLPTLIVGLLILTAGWLMSGFAAELMQATVTGLEPGQSAMLERVVRISILVGAILVGADQIGIRITFLAIFIGAIAITVGGGLALAVGFGARGHVANLIAGSPPAAAPPAAANCAHSASDCRAPSAAGLYRGSNPAVRRARRTPARDYGNQPDYRNCRWAGHAACQSVQ